MTRRCCAATISELACEATADWPTDRVGLSSFIPAGQPRRNGYIESFNGRVRVECLSINSFWSLAINSFWSVAPSGS